jgi:Ca2+-binding EF-hand superfamily protein
VSNEEAFRKMDKNKDGFLCIDEWSGGIDTFLQLSDDAKQGFFNFMDKTNIGMVDIQQFMEQMKMNLVKEEVKKEYDNFDFQVNIIKEIHNWVNGNNLTADDAFRVIDNDFDGFLSRSDLSHFLKNVLHYDEKIVTSPIVDRLFKLMD